MGIKTNPPKVGGPSLTMGNDPQQPEFAGLNPVWSSLLSDALQGLDAVDAEAARLLIDGVSERAIRVSLGLLQF